MALPDFRQSAEQSIGHVRPRLVDHGHHTERHPDAADVEAVGQPVPSIVSPTGSGSADDRAHVAGDPREPLRVELEPVEQARVEPGLGPASMSRSFASRISCVRSSTASAIA